MNYVPNPRAHSRAHIRLTNQAEVMNFVQMLNTMPHAFSIESTNGSRRIDAKSVLGVMYFSFELQDEMYLVNDSIDGHIPSCIDVYRVP